jgi:hypothetical protein
MDRCQLPPHRGGLLAEHWDVIEAEATRSESLSGLQCTATTSPRIAETPRANTAFVSYAARKAQW